MLIGLAGDNVEAALLSGDISCTAAQSWRLEPVSFLGLDMALAFQTASTALLEDIGEGKGLHPQESDLHEAAARTRYT